MLPLLLLACAPKVTRTHVPETGTQTVEANGLTFHYFEEGEGDLFDSYDTISKIRVAEPRFVARLGDGEDDAGQPLTVYTDGSRFNDMAGAGIAIYTPEGDEILKSLHLGPYATVFQAEVIAIQRAAEMITAMASRRHLSMNLVS